MYSYQFHDFMHCAWQAYTNELENKVSHLEEENERLKKHKVLLSPVIVVLFSFSCSFCRRYSTKANSKNRHIAIGLPLSKMYTNSLLSALNARQGWTRDGNTTDVLHALKPGTRNSFASRVITVRGPTGNVLVLSNSPLFPIDSTGLFEHGKTISSHHQFEKQLIIQLRRLSTEATSKCNYLVALPRP